MQVSTPPPNPTNLPTKNLLNFTPPRSPPLYNTNNYLPSQHLATFFATLNQSPNASAYSSSATSLDSLRRQASRTQIFCETTLTPSPTITSQSNPNFPLSHSLASFPRHHIGTPLNNPPHHHSTKIRTSLTLPPEPAHPEVPRIPNH